MKQSKFLEVALEAAKKAEEVIMNYYSKELDTTRKSDKSIVTIADQEAEKIIIDTIKKEFPGHGFFGEEFGKNNAEAEYLWIIDPIDGTNNFWKKIPIFATQIALMRNGKIILGVSNAPVLRELLYAEKGTGAYCNGEKISVSKIEKIENAYMSYGGPKHFEKKGITSQLIKLSTDVLAARGFGDFWSYHLLAQGKIDLMAEAKVKLFDIAALVVIVEEAGGLVTDLENNSITINSNSIMATNKRLHKESFKYFSKA